MNQTLTDMLERIGRIEGAAEVALQERVDELKADFEDKQIRFTREVLEQQRRLKMGVVKYLLDADLRNLVTSPIIYAVFLPMLAIDLAVTAYQWICFPLYRMAPVRRRDYLVFDRAHLAYLNGIEALNCAYCSYANGLAAYIKEVIGRTEQYWCPIKHARRVLQAHPYYASFVAYGDAGAYRGELEGLRALLRPDAAAQPAASAP